MRIFSRLAALAALGAATWAVAAVAGSNIGIEVAPEDDGPAATPPPARPRPVAEASPAASPEPVPVRPRAALPRASAGLAVADRGMRIALANPAVPTGRPHTLRFRLAGGSARRVALTLVRRDVRYLQRPRARREAGGDWAADVRLAKAGTYRLIADVDGGRRVLGTDVFAGGDFQPMPLPAPSPTTEVDGYLVRAQWRGASLRLGVSRRGQAVAALPAGPLVALRDGDLAYAAVRPRGRALRYRIGYPGPGTYRVFAPFADRGRVHVAALTRNAPR